MADKFKKLTEDELLARCPNCKADESHIKWNEAQAADGWVHGCRSCGKLFKTGAKYINKAINK